MKLVVDANIFISALIPNYALQMPKKKIFSLIKAKADLTGQAQNKKDASRKGAKAQKGKNRNRSADPPATARHKRAGYAD